MTDLGRWYHRNNSGQTSRISISAVFVEAVVKLEIWKEIQLGALPKVPRESAIEVASQSSELPNTRQKYNLI